jgi:hypothetical protein
MTFIMLAAVVNQRAGGDNTCNKLQNSIVAYGQELKLASSQCGRDTSTGSKNRLPSPWGHHLDGPHCSIDHLSEESRRTLKTS